MAVASSPRSLQTALSNDQNMDLPVPESWTDDLSSETVSPPKRKGLSLRKTGATGEGTERDYFNIGGRARDRSL